MSSMKVWAEGPKGSYAYSTVSKPDPLQERTVTLVRDTFEVHRTNGSRPGPYDAMHTPVL